MTKSINKQLELPSGPPPVLPDVTAQLNEYIQCPERLPIHDYEKAQKFWPRVPNIHSLFYGELSPLATTLKVSRDLTTGEILEITEVENLAETTKGLYDSPTQTGETSEINSRQQTAALKNIKINFEKDLLVIAPGLLDGIEFNLDGFTPIKDETKQTPTKAKKKNARNEDQQSEVVNLKTLLHQEQDIMQLLKDPEAKENEPKRENVKPPIVELTLSQTDEDTVLPKETPLPPVLKISEAVASKKPLGKAQWAEEIDMSLPVEDFDKKIPDPAFRWSFELDNFQKQAILKLEDHQNVFVSAHTSAGKTVVAEYAIALSYKQHTRAIYTSPIKALSNQKYHDFKRVFQDEHKLGDVGLITGDVQLNTKAGCLIMTTEILRSMLYKDNEVIHDLEYVIFDEVHYINDKERGHVWEEVVILLPPHVNIVMLSATVPNTLEFANWVGRTKERKMYVISTMKRPVPLEHYLYIGSKPGNTNDEEYFLIRRAEGPFLVQGYSDAVEAKKRMQEKKQSAESGGRGGRGGRTLYRPHGGRPPMLTAKQEQAMFESLIKFLKRKQYLPVVIFTLSRNRCDKNARMLLSSSDLTTKDEKHFIHRFFTKNISRLKEEDRDLPQVKNLMSLLQKGIGIHHSGILPILKEIVELLFQEGKVKLLFATETFAMGVNMPAKTVVFDSVVKFDGESRRLLLPAEYIQMAGRAGRRGKDETGKVIIMCKTEIPVQLQIKNMMFDKPMPLESQFRTTYSMILKNLKRSSSVENMMTKSFKEFDEQKRHFTYKKMLEQANREYEIEKSKHEVQKFGEDILEEFYRCADMYIQTHKALWGKFVTYPKVKRELEPGRLIMITQGQHVNKMGYILSMEKTQYLTLVLQNENEIVDNPEFGDDFYRMRSMLYPHYFFTWDGRGGHTILKILPENILEITVINNKKLNAQLIYQSWYERQQPRFKDMPIGTVFRQALEDLAIKTLNMNTSYFINIFHLINLGVELEELIGDANYWKNKLDACCAYTIPNRDILFKDVYKLKKAEAEVKHYKYLLSNESMSLTPDLRYKEEVLKNLNYIDDMKSVEMKGKVAMLMGSNELMITELMFRYILKDMPPAVIAALLSGLVFQAKTNYEPKTECLKEGQKLVEVVYKDLMDEERACNVEPGNTSVGIYPLNFGLMDVVYHWALNEPFCEIMKLTDVQEGIIVRCIQQLTELLRYVKEAARVLGDPTTGSKMDEVINAIARDIVFAPSLYTTD